MRAARLKALGKSFLGLALSEYRINWVYAARVSVPQPQDPEPRPLDEGLKARIGQSATAKVRNCLSYAAAGLVGFALVENGRPVCVAHFAGPESYGRHQTWPLGADEIALMDIATEDAMRGLGLAPALIRGASRKFLDAGARRVIAFVWWSNKPSLAAFRRAGWQRIGLSIELCLTDHWYVFQLPL